MSWLRSSRLMTTAASSVRLNWRPLTRANCRPGPAELKLEMRPHRREEGYAAHSIVGFFPDWAQSLRKRLIRV
jgi:hypothetical protein